MIKLLGSLAFVVAMSFMSLPSAMASDETPTVQKGDDNDKDGKRRRHHKHHRKHHHRRHHKHADENKDDKK